MSLIADLVGSAACAGCRIGPEALCSSCRTKVFRALEREVPAGVKRLLVPWSYGGPVRSLVLDLKLRARRAPSTPLVDAMVAEVWKSGLEGSVLTWVPARKADNRRRGYDHAALLAGGLGHRLGLRTECLLVRRGSALDQAGLGREERRRNLEGSFEARRKIDGPVVLIDDVITTGATISACARALRRAGARSVEAVVACSAE